MRPGVSGETGDGASKERKTGTVVLKCAEVHDSDGFEEWRNEKYREGGSGFRNGGESWRVNACDMHVTPFYFPPFLYT